jgi:23S rRNA (uracil1939-C5)-methyltransferase
MICPHAALCGGCSLLDLSYAEQLSSKEARLRELLQGAGVALPGSALSGARPGLFVPVPIDVSGPSRFRQKVAFAFAPSPSGRGFVMGHYQRGTQRVVPVQECFVHSARANRIAFALRDHLQRAAISAAGPSLTGLLRHLLIRTTADDRQAVAMLVVTRNDRSLRAPIRALMDSLDAPDGFHVNINSDPGPFMVGDTTIHVAGRSHVREDVGGIAYLVTPTAFFQTNVEAARALQSHVVQSAAPATRVLDLYCGSGLFALPLAAAGVQVTGVEENRQAIEDAKANARANRIPSARVRFIASRVEDAVRSLSRNAWDAVILDPPRQGCSDAVLEAVFQEMRPPNVTYVSCNPTSLAAELPGILQRGYVVDDVRAVDMFPHTDHIEVVVRLTSVKPPFSRS